MTLTIKSFGFSTFQTNLLTIPYNALFLCNNFALTSLSKWTGERTIVASLGTVWQFILMLAIVLIPNDTNNWAKYVLLTLFLAYPYAHPILVAWNSANSGSVRTRSVSASAYNMFVQMGSIVSSQVYRDSDKPYYNTGNRVLLGIICLNLICFAATKPYLMWRNNSKARRWDAMTPEERDEYLSTTEDKGNRRLDFRFVH